MRGDSRSFIALDDAAVRRGSARALLLRARGSSPHDTESSFRRGTKREILRTVVSEENVELVRETFEAWNRGDLEAVLESLGPGWQWHPARLFPGTDAVYRGKEGFTRFWNTFREPWESIRIEIERIEDLEDRILVLIMFYGKGKGSGVDVTGEYANVFTFRDGLVTYQVGYGDWKSALDAVGLLEDAHPSR
jgi:ketosteroid isomerase-like protein